ncbi:YraN family protein [Roseovarius sp.]|uniref:YraN family protein n=1 Tax=Roseovarius sp. TaxID=1486281 RepID=UPI003A973600
MRQLAFDFEARGVPEIVRPSGLLQRQDRGRRAYLSGQAAEASVIRLYEASGACLLHKRWRGQSGEIDLILRAPETYVFCEVKKAATFDLALQRLHEGQMRRIYAAASEYLGLTPEGQLAPVRFDLGVVDCTGAVRLLENAFGHF